MGSCGLLWDGTAEAPEQGAGQLDRRDTQLDQVTLLKEYSRDLESAQVAQTPI